MSKQYVPQESQSRFYIPPTLASDFTTFLSNDIPNMVMDFELLTDWYAQFEEDYEKEFIRGEIYSDATKSRYSNTDNNINFRADVHSGIKKGDMIIDPDGHIFVFDWFVQYEHNNAPTRALRCNARITFTRHETEKTDNEGYLVDEDGFLIEEPVTETNQEIVIAKDMPCNVYRYDGRPEYVVVSGAAGASPNAVTVITMQYNKITDEINIGDTFEWGKTKYFIVDINYNGLDVNSEFGVIVVQAKKVSGGEY